MAKSSTKKMAMAIIMLAAGIATNFLASPCDNVRICNIQIIIIIILIQFCFPFFHLQKSNKIEINICKYGKNAFLLSKI